MRPLAFLFLLTSSLLAAPALTQAQAAPESAPAAARRAERMPIFPGGDTLDVRASVQRFGQFILDSLRVPARARHDQVAGRVFIRFAVLADGRTAELQLAQGLRADVDSAVLAAARRLRRVRWQPGTQGGRPVRVVLTAPVTIGAFRSGWLPDSLDLPRFTKLKLPTGAWNLAKAPPAGAGIIYGSCLQRLGFSSGGLGQYVRVVNLTTGQVFRLNVKPIMRSRRENPFCYALPAGRYALSRYEFSGSAYDLREEQLRKLASPGVSGVAATRYVFTILPGQLHYVGTWNLANANEPLFIQEKELLDAVLQAEYPTAPLAGATVALPH